MKAPPWTMAELAADAKGQDAAAFAAALGAPYVLVSASGFEPEAAQAWSFQTRVGVASGMSDEIGLDLSSAYVYPVSKRRSTFFPGTILVGRAANNDIVIEHESVSKLHARVRSHERGFWLEDAGSQNGTFVDDQRVSAGTVVRPGEIVRFGECQFLVIRTTELHPLLRGP